MALPFGNAALLPGVIGQRMMTLLNIARSPNAREISFLGSMATASALLTNATTTHVHVLQEFSSDHLKTLYSTIRDYPPEELANAPNISEGVPDIVPLTDQQVRQYLHLSRQAPELFRSNTYGFNFLARALMDPGTSSYFLYMYIPPLAQGMGLQTETQLPQALTVNLTGPADSSKEFWTQLFEIIVDDEEIPTPPNPNLLPMIKQIRIGFKAMQSLKSIGWYLFTVNKCLRSLIQGGSPQFKIGVVIRRIQQDQVEPNFFYVQFPMVLYGESFYTFGMGESPARMVQTFINDVYQFFKENEGRYDYVFAQDSVLVRYIKVMLKPTSGAQIVLRNPTSRLAFASTTQNFTQEAFALTDLRLMIRQALMLTYANKDPRDAPEINLLEIKFSKLSNARSRDCFLKAMIAYTLMQREDFYDLCADIFGQTKLSANKATALRKKREHMISNYQDRLCNDEQTSYIFENSNLYSSMQRYLERLSLDFEEDECRLCVCLFNGYASERQHYLINVTFQDDKFDFEVLDPDLFDPESPIIYVYRAHAFITTLFRVRNVMGKHGGSYGRIQSLYQHADHEPYTLTKLEIADEQLRSKILKGEDKGVTAEKGYLTIAGDIVLSFDCETGRCTECTEFCGTGFEQHAVCVALAFSVTRGICFNGVQCERKSARELSRTGCMDQFIDYLFENYHCEEKSASQVFIVSHSGRGFDMFLLAYALLARKVQFTPIMQSSSKIMQIIVGNLRFIDFYNFYPGTLESVFNSFVKDSNVKGYYGALIPNLSKYKCYPYGLLSTEYYGKILPFDVLKRDDIWGGKDCDKKAPGTIGQKNSTWWLQNINGGVEKIFDTVHEAQVYCQVDTYVLQLCAETHYRNVAYGVYRDQAYDCSTCSTIGSMVLKIVRYCFINDDHLACGASKRFRLPVAVTWAFGQSSPITLHKMIKDSIRGALTYNNTRFYQGKCYKYDINSSYPAIMAKKLPIKVNSLEFYKEDKDLTQVTFEDTDLLWIESDCSSCPIQGMTIQYSGVTLAPYKLPFEFYDPSSKECKLNMHWGDTVKFHASCGAVIKVRAIVRFEAYALFAEAIDTFYRQRLESRGLNPDTHLPDPALPIKPFITLVRKLQLNNIFGKTMEHPKPSCMFVHEAESYIEACYKDIIDVTPVNIGPHSMLMLEYFESHAFPGELEHIGSYILSAGRLNLTKGMFGLYQLKDCFGNPCEALCGDTDSMLVPAPIASEASNQWTLENCHSSHLGKWKLEDTALCVMSAAKKMYIYEREERDKQDQPQYEGANKGVPQGSVTWNHFKEMILEQKSVPIQLPTQFNQSMTGLFELPPATRRIKASNKARKWLADGIHSTAWEDLKEFSLAHDIDYNTNIHIVRDK